MAPEPTEDKPHVMISLALEDDQQLDINAWETWLAGFPALAKYVKVQGIFKSHSTLLLLSLPVMVWDLLPDDPACSFVAFIRSNNLLHAQQTAPEPVDVPIPVASGVPETNQARDDAESCSGTTIGGTTIITPTENGSIVGYGPAASSGSRPIHTAPAWIPSFAKIQVPALNTRPSVAASLKTATSTTSLSSLRRPETLPRNLSAATGSELHSPIETISRKMILNTSRSSKRSVFQSHQDIPEGQPMAQHVIRRLEDYFQKDPDPSVGVIEHLASNLGVETADIHVSPQRSTTLDCLTD
jgi:hypothetical protein